MSVARRHHHYTSHWTCRSPPEISKYFTACLGPLVTLSIPPPPLAKFSLSVEVLPTKTPAPPATLILEVASVTNCIGEERIGRLWACVCSKHLDRDDTRVVGI